MDFIQACERIISIDSCASVGTDYVVDYAKALASELGLSSEVLATKVDGVEQKLICIRKVAARSHDLVLWSNLDTLEPGSYSHWKETDHNPYLSTIKGERIYGLGTATGKLDFLVKMQALSEFSGGGSKISPVLVGSFGKEDNFSGARYFLSQCKNKIHGVLVGEPTDLKIVNQFSGSVIVKMDLEFTDEEKIRRRNFIDEETTSTQTKIFRGKACHASSPQFGKSAFVDLKNYVEKLPSNTLMLSVEAGTSPYIIPEEAILELDVGFAGVDSVRDRLLTFLKKIDEVFQERFTRYVKRYDLQDFPPYNIGFVRTHEKGIELEGTFFLTDGIDKERVRSWLKLLEQPNLKLSLSSFKAPSKMSEGHGMIQSLKEVLRGFKLSEDLEWKHKVSDASYFQMKGISAVAFGAGAIEGSSYLPNEFNLLPGLRASKKIYSEILERICV